MAATAIAFTATPATTSEAATKPRLLVAKDYLIPCRTMDRTGSLHVETVDFAFKVGKRVIMQATDGFQFSVVVIGGSQNTPFACIPAVPVGVPASWAND